MEGVLSVLLSLAGLALVFLSMGLAERDRARRRVSWVRVAVAAPFVAAALWVGWQYGVRSEWDVRAKAVLFGVVLVLVAFEALVRRPAD